MGEVDSLKIILFFLVLAGFFSGGFWIWAWIAGPAVRHLGKCWEEGRQRAEDTHLRGRAGVGAVGAGMAAPALPVIRDGTAAPLEVKIASAPEAPKKFTITGREIR